MRARGSKDIMERRGNKPRTKKPVDPLPEEFASLEEAAEFWDTHDTVDYEEFMRDVEFEVDLKPRTHLVTIEGRVYDRVRAVAKKRRVPIDKHVSRWIEEKLRSAA